MPTTLGFSLYPGLERSRLNVSRTSLLPPPPSLLPPPPSQTDLERCKRDLEAALSREEAAVSDASSQRALALTLGAEVAGLKAAHECSSAAEAALRCVGVVCAGLSEAAERGGNNALCPSPSPSLSRAPGASIPALPP